jgi:hypothetical protein
MDSKENNILSLDKKIFRSFSNSSNGEVSIDTLFYYFQQDDIVWADYSGGEIRKGHLIGKQLENGDLEFFYHHVNNDGDIKIGKCTSKIKMENNKIKLYEKWQWLCDDRSSGTSELIECT